MKIKNSLYWQKITDGLKNVFSQSPIECTLFCLAAIFLVINVYVTDGGAFDDHLLVHWALWMIPFALLSYVINHLLKDTHRWIYNLLIPSAVLVFFVVVSILMKTLFFNEIVYYGVLILSVLALLLSNEDYKNTSVFMDACQKLIAQLMAMAISLIIYLLCLAILASIDYLFEANFYNGYEVLTIISWVSIAPILFFALDGTFSADRLFQRKLIKIIYNYILSPAAFLYLLFLYVYIIKVLVIGELPHGEITYIVSAFMAFAFICHLFNDALSIPVVSKFYHYLHIGVLPPLVLAWLGAVKRISAYGFTEWRIFMLAMLILLSIYVLTLFFRKFKFHLSLAVAIAALMCALLTLIKPINIRNLAIDSIQNRCERMIETYHLLDEDCVNMGNCSAMDPTDRAELRNLLWNLQYRTDLNPSMSDLEDVLDDMAYSDNENTSSDRYFQNHYTTLDIAEYKKMIWVRSSSNYDSDVVIEFLNGSIQPVKIKFSDVDEHIHSIVGDTIPNKLPAEAFVYRFDNKAVVFKHYEIKNNHLVTGYIQDVILEK